MKPTIIAHRGNNYTFPENSLSGLRSAFELGCTAVEFDIQLTKDGVLAIVHDVDTARTSDINKNVLESNFEDLKDVSVHEPTRFSEMYKPTPISRIEDFFPLLDKFSQAHAYIEVKYQSLKKYGHQELLNKLLPLATKYKNQCTIISFDLKVLELVKAQSDLAIGWVLERYDQQSLDHANHAKPDFLIIDLKKLSLQEKPWQGNWEWMVYGADSADSAFQHYNNGVQHVETDHLQRLLSDPRLTP